MATVDETLVRQVAGGQPATVTFDALPGQTFAGQVEEVPLQGELQGGVMVYEVPISLEDIGDAPLLVGMTADVEIATGTAQDALLVPAMALQRSSGVYQVLVQADDGSTTAVPVEVGVSDGVYTQILRGLNEGDKVVFQVEAGSSSSDFRGMGGLMGGSAPRNLTR